MNNVQEFSVAIEQVTATMTLPISGGEHFGPPLTIGIYPGGSEIWIECEVGRINIPSEHVNAFIKQIRRAAKISKDSDSQ
ncbi:MAG: hypothetical protein JWP38_3680 [Herbaspirillum sp.]|nr:hypothetical protein [Herbaspirillum sp.]